MMIMNTQREARQNFAEMTGKAFALRIPETHKTNRKANEFLDKAGVLPHLRGYTYIIEGITILAGNPTAFVTKEVYPVIAELYGTTGHSVERSIRHAIEVAYKNSNARMGEYFTGCPSNSQFLAYATRKIYG